MKSYSVCLSLPDLFHIAQYPPGPSILSQMARFRFCWYLSNFPIYIYTPIFLSIYLSIDTLVASVLAIVNNAAVNILEKSTVLNQGFHQVIFIPVDRSEIFGWESMLSL